MISLLCPGLGKENPHIFSINIEEKKTIYSYLEALLSVTPVNKSDHLLSSLYSSAESIACAKEYLKLNGTIDFCSGYSVGQIAALAITESISVESALQLILNRALLMKKYMPPNYTMLNVIGLSQDQIQSSIEQVGYGNRIYFSTINSQYNHTICGKKEDLDFILNQLSFPSIKATFLQVEGAWHSPFLRESLEEYSDLLDQIEFKKPKYKFVCNFSGAEESDPFKIKKNLMEHMCSPVLWQKTIETLVQMGTTTFIECGSGDQIKKILFYMRTKPCFSMGHLEDIKKCAALSV